MEFIIAIEGKNVNYSGNILKIMKPPNDVIELDRISTIVNGYGQKNTYVNVFINEFEIFYRF